MGSWFDGGETGNEVEFDVIYQAWDARVFHHQMKHREGSWKYDAQRSISDELRGVSSGDEAMCRMLDITSQTKWFYKEKLRMQKWAFFRWFPNTHQTLISFVFSLWIINEFEKLLVEFGCYVPSYGKNVLLNSTAVSFSRSKCSGIGRTHPLSLSTQYNLIVNTPITSVILLTGKRKPIPRTWDAEDPVNSVFSSIEMDSWCQIIQRGPYLKSTDLRNANRLDISWKATCKVIVDKPKDKLCQEKTNEIYTEYMEWATF